MPMPSTPARHPGDGAIRTHSDNGAVRSTRPYRSRKRERPCDRCRDQKLKCEKEGQTSCTRCRRNGAACTYLGRPRRRGSADTPTRQAAEMSTEEGVVTATEEPEPIDTSMAASNGALDGSYDTFSLSLGNTSLAGLQQRPITQISQSLDQMKGHNTLLLGTSSGSDPWLLRHFRFDEVGTRSFHRTHIRNAGGVPTFDKIPVHFLLSEDGLSAGVAADTWPYSTNGLRERLNVLVPPSMGMRLIRLFHHSVFPNLPVISRTDLGLSSVDAIPDVGVLETVPLHLLAAMYGSALPFASSDDELTVLLTHDDIPLDEIWHIAYSSLHEEMHRPHLSVLQASLLYLHKKHDDRHRYTTIDTAFLWPFMGQVIGLAHNLGVHLECGMMGFPAKEKRLRRRLWWAVYVEDKFLSLLLGRPPYIRSDEWDVNPLCAADFHPFPPDHSRSPFQDMADLALIADNVQSTLYSLRSCQKLAVDLSASIQAARPVFEALNAWRANIPAPQNYHMSHTTSTSSPGQYPTGVYFAYLTLVAYVWRALLRPTVRSQPPPQIIDFENDPRTFNDSGFLFEDLSWDFSDLPELEIHLEEDVTDASATIKDLNQAAQTWAASLVTFTANLSSRDFGDFWYSWSRLSFIVVSNFLVMLLVQAPTDETAQKGKQMLDQWRLVLRDQSRASPLLLLALTELSGLSRAGISETFCLPSHVQEAL